MKLLTQEILDAVPSLYANENVDPGNTLVVAKFFTPWTGWTWYMTEYDPESDRAFGLVEGFEKELGYFSIEELESVTGPGGLTIERDLYFGKHMLSEFM